MLRPLGIQIQADYEMKAVAVSGRPEEIAVVEEAIKRLDVSPPAPFRRNSMG